MTQTDYLLVQLADECCEVAHDAHKSIHFGLTGTNAPLGPTNQYRIVAELNDLWAVVQMCVDAGIIPSEWRDLDKVAAKRVKVEKFMRLALPGLR